MLEVLLETELDRVNKKVSISNLCGGVVFDKYGTPIKKILFIKKDNVGYNVFNNESYPIEEGETYISEVVYLGEAVYDFLQQNNLTLAQLYMVYKMFLNDRKFINKNLNYFGMREVEVGYDFKTEIREAMPGFLNDKVEMYKTLMRIMDFEKLKKERKNGKHNKQ